MYVGQGKALPAPPDTAHLAGQPVELLLRPESVTLASTSEGLEGHAIGVGCVEAITFGGAFERVSVRLDDGQTVSALLSTERARVLALRGGDTVWVGVRDYHLIGQN
ncbi:MAG: TOBE domain-containing protein [Anaerolineae bacterium]|nr:TOBE domain-containing protein [Anaerolineae bacterium]